MRLLAILALFAAAAPQARAGVWTQTGWQGGAVSGSTTSASTGWVHYESADGATAAGAGGVQIQQAIGKSWLQTSDGTGDDGFSRIGSVLSSTTVLGTGASAVLKLLHEDTMTVRAAALPQGRGDMAAVSHPGTGDIYLLGGRNSDGTAAKDIYRYTPLTDTLSGPLSPLKDFITEAGAAYHDTFNTIFVVGGSSGSTFLEGIFSYTPSLNLSIKRGGVLPSSRTLVASEYHPAKNRIYILGGLDDTPALLDQIIEYNPAVETLITLSTALPTPRYGMASVYHPGTQKIYLFGGADAGGDLDQILSYDPVAGTVTVMGATLPSARRKLSAAYFPPTGQIVLFGGVSASSQFDVMAYDAVLDTLTVRTATLPTARGGMAVAFDTSTARIYGFGASSGTPAHFSQILEYAALSSGVYVSAPFDTGNLSDLTTISWSSSVPSGGQAGVSLGFRAGDTPSPDGSWTNAGSSAAVLNGASLAGFGDHRYVQYVASFTTTDLSTSATLADLTVSYAQTAPSSTLTSSVFDGGEYANVLQALRWSGAFPAGTTAHFQIRTASDAGGGFPAAFTSWMGPTSASDFYTDPAGGDAVHPSHKDGVEDRFFQYRMVLYSTDTAATPLVSSVTVQFNALPSSPTLTALTALSTGSFRADFTDRSTTEDEFLIRYGPSPGFVVGVTTVTSLDKAGVGTSSSGTAGGFTPNQLLFVSIRSHILPPDDLVSSSDTATEGSVFTLANPPLSPAITSVALTTLTVNWAANGNAANTPYEVSLSTDDFATIVSTPVVFADNLTATTTDVVGLEYGTTYYVRVRAQNGNAIATNFSAAVSTQTLPLPASGLAVASVGVTSITWSWNTSGPAALYRIFNAATDVVIATATGTSYTGPSLATNSLNGIYIEPFTGQGLASTSAAVSTYTLAAPASFLNASFSSTDTLSLVWDAAGNPAGTVFELLMSSDDFAADVSTPVAFSLGLTLPTTSILGLDAGTTYYFKVRARNAALIPTSFTAPVATQTVPSQLAAPTTAAIGVTSITWTWSNTAGPSVGRFDLYIASGSGAVNDSSALISGATQTTLVETGLGPNSRHVLQIAPVNETGAGALSAPTTVFTLANPPAGSVITGVFVASLTIAFDSNSNSELFTTYDVEHATDNANFGALSTFTLTGTATKTIVSNGLSGFTTHYFRIRARNNDGIPTPYDATVSTFLFGAPPQPPGGFSADSAENLRILLGWTISPSTTVVEYRIYTDSGTGTIDYAILFASVSGQTTHYLTPPLSEGTTYVFGLRARDSTGLEENNSSVIASAVALSTLSAVTARIAAPSGGLKIAGDRVGVLAELTRGLASNVEHVRFQYRTSGAGAWTDIVSAQAGRPNPAATPPYAARWDVTGLASGHYDLRAVARAKSGTDDPSPAAVTVSVDPGDPDVQETDVGGGTVRKRQRIHDTVPVSLVLIDGGRDVLTKVEIASGALTTTPTFLRVESDPAGWPNVPSRFSDTLIRRSISLESGQTTFPGGAGALVTFSRLDQDDNNRVDGTAVRADNLAIYVYDAAGASWKLDFASAVDAKDGLTVSGLAPHFSLFGLFSASADDLSSVRIYPVPYKPNGTNSDEGKPFSQGDPTSGIVFDGLVQGSLITIYTVNGELVWKSPRIAGGLYHWDVRNGDGAELASGVYFALITADGGGKTIRKLVVIR